MRNIKNIVIILIWLGLIAVIANTGFISTVLNKDKTAEVVTVQEDEYMTTNQYRSAIRVEEDNSYHVEEYIDVSFRVPRHGIYRYIPYKGIIFKDMEDGTVESAPYRAAVKLLSSEVKTASDHENDNAVFRFGDEDFTVNSGIYNFSYTVKPVTKKGYTHANYNVFPASWQNEIPAGSQFTVEFPKDFPHEILKLYYGAYGEKKDGKEILELSWEGNTLTGTLTEALPLGTGLTFYAPMPEGYFTGVATTAWIPWMLIAVSAAVLLITLGLFLLFGRDDKIYPSIQYYPPEGLDSAAVGYVIDGYAEDKDMVSLLVYWADKGYMKIEEAKQGQMTFIKQKDLESDSPEYALTIFNGIFGKDAKAGKKVKLSSLKYKFVPKMQKAKKQLKKDLDTRGEGGIYTAASQYSRLAAGVLSIVPLGAFVVVAGIYSIGSGMMIWGIVFLLCYIISLIFLCYTVDKWHAKSNSSRNLAAWGSAAGCLTGLVGFSASYLSRVYQGTVFGFIVPLIIMVICSVVILVLTAFMKKRSRQAVEWMGYLIGLRDFIETAELDRIEILAEENPHWFYHLMPYAYVFGLSNVWMKKFEQISLPAPEWYSNTTGRMDMFDFYIFHSCMMRNLNEASKTFVTPKPETSGSSGDSFGGGSGGGGFSGGGFGGGGGGSW